MTGLIGFALWTLGSLMMPLMIHMVILQTAPFWTSILGTIFNKEKVSAFEYFAMTLCLATIGFVIFSKPENRQQLAGA
jgi:drug/metabolite transporter (DMT)-like permease